jgi:16S rRNA (cytidine1402-2'-O)-methyltransferase
MAVEEQSSGAAPLAPGLYLVATPIGNLEDITLRALRVLRSVERIACEDTRQTQKLLNHFGIATPTVSYHMHNEEGRATELVTELKAGARIALVSDAGTPGIADPGAVLTAAAIEAGVPVVPIPGASAVATAYSASGLAGSAERAGEFRFRGFLPSKEGQRRTALEQIRASAGADPVTEIIYEAPHRILDTLCDMETVFGPGQHVVVGRELTKLHEEFLRGSVAEVRATLSSRASVRGEIVLLFVPAVATGSSTSSGRGSIAVEVRTLMEQEKLGEMDALKKVAKARGMGKSQAYRELQRDRKRSPAR